MRRPSRAWLETASIEQQLSAAWVAVEALFYGVCHGVASQASAALAHSPLLTPGEAVGSYGSAS